ncbi:flagellar export chaperone FliS [Armatimonas sp.]|uniref:flagellar export chaperone FliS n=1 Tax=Armatimonas sp. TaxID=1872638 RepID=UPI00375264FA
MVGSYARSQYQEMQVQTTPERLVVMLYDGAIFALERALGAMRQGDIKLQAASITKAEEIICHLMGTLNMSAGPIAYDLDKIYRGCLVSLLTAHTYDDISGVQEVAGALSNLREGWAEAERKLAIERLNPTASLVGASA